MDLPWTKTGVEGWRMAGLMAGAVLRVELFTATGYSLKTDFATYEPPGSKDWCFVLFDVSSGATARAGGARWPADAEPSGDHVALSKIKMRQEHGEDCG